jgi:hypothetical protein
MKRRHYFNLALALTYIAALVIFLLDMLVWRPQ